MKECSRVLYRHSCRFNRGEKSLRFHPVRTGRLRLAVYEMAGWNLQKQRKFPASFEAAAGNAGGQWFLKIGDCKNNDGITSLMHMNLVENFISRVGGEKVGLFFSPAHFTTAGERNPCSSKQGEKVLACRSVLEAEAEILFRSGSVALPRALGMNEDSNPFFNCKRKFPSLPGGRLLIKCK